jgi:hypothetical protein
MCGIQVDLQLESGEYFLKPTERKRREERERKQKVCFADRIIPVELPCDVCTAS